MGVSLLLLKAPVSQHGILLSLGQLLLFRLLQRPELTLFFRVNVLMWLFCLSVWTSAVFTAGTRRAPSLVEPRPGAARPAASVLL